MSKEDEKMSKVDNILSIDEKSRELIINGLDSNYFVEASAGSGKTTSLVYRMVSLVEKGDHGRGVPVNKICTITFTKAAADEFYSRFQKLLSIRSVLTPDDSEKFLGKKTPESIKRCEEALNNIDSCFMGTIDSFCNMIAHEFPFELGIPSDTELISEDEFGFIVTKQYENILKNDKHPLHRHALLFKDTFPDAYNKFAVGIDLVKSNRNIKIDYNSSIALVEPEEYLKEYKQSLLDIFDSITKAYDKYHIDFGTDKNNDAIKSISINNHKFKTEDWRYLLSSLYYSIKNLIGMSISSSEVEKSTLISDNVIEAETKADGSLKAKLKFTQEVTDILEGALEKIKRYRFSLYFYVISECLNEIASELKKQGKFQYSDFRYYLNQAFKQSASTDRVLANHILDKHSYFMIDESQDTEPMLMEMFFYLSGTKISDDWTKCEPKEGSLFIVGDPKQSIYAFAGASVQAYKKTEDIFKAKDEVLVLSKNFRSNVTLREWFNFTMDKLLNRGSEPLKHEDIDIPLKDKNAEIAGEFNKGDILIDGPYYYDSDKDNDSSNVAKIIKDLVLNQNKKIISKVNGKYTYRSLDFKDFLVVPRSTNVKDLVDAFKEYQIPYYIEATIPFEYSDSLMILIDLVKLLKEPNNKALLLKVLFSDLYRFNESDVIDLVNHHYDFDISIIDNLKASNINLKKALLELNDLYLKTIDKSFSSTMLIIKNDLNYRLLERVSTDYLEYTDYLIELTKSHEEVGNITSLKSFEDIISAIISHKDKHDRVLRYQNTLNKVKVANLHKVKGLQAPIVILCKPVTFNRKPQSYFDYADLAHPILRIQSVSAESNGNSLPFIDNPDFSDTYKGEMLAADRAEKDRLEYVAATRAESVLIVARGPLKMDGRYYNPWDTIVNFINVKYDIPDIAIEDFSKLAKAKYDEPNLDESTYVKTTEFVSPSKAAHDYKYESTINNLNEMDENDDLYDKDQDKAFLIGSLVHRLMENIIISKNNILDINALIRDIVDEYRPYVKDEDQILNDVYQTIVTKGYHQKNSVLDDDILSVLLKAKDVRAEVPFSYKRGNQIISGSIDCLYEDESGYHIIDWKTNNFDDISKLEVQYKGQLDEYVLAMEHFGIKADAHIYRIAIKQKTNNN